MSSISSLTKAVSGLTSAQKGLQVTGQNLSNLNTTGYTRQQLLQHETGYLTIGVNGGYKQQVGLGVSNTEIRQIRDALTDRRIRTEQSVLSYYQELTTASTEIENLFDEPYGSNIGDLMSSFWGQAQKLNTAPDGVEERLSFINSAQVLITKINDIADALVDQQYSLNTEIETAVDSINSIIDQIAEMNKKIAEAEANNKDHANDYRDQRNVLLDQLAEYGDISYYEAADGRVTVQFEGHTVVDKEITSKMEMVSKDGNNTFDVPAWVSSGREVFKMNTELTSINENATGKLKALLVARGEAIVTKDTTWSDVAINDNLSVDTVGNNYVIPKTMMLLNTFTEQLTSMVNECFNGTGIGPEQGNPGETVFVEISEGLGMVAGNIQVNPKLLEAGGYNKLGTVTETTPDNVGDNSKVTEFLNEWGKNRDWFSTTTDPAAPVSKNLTLTAFYNSVVTDIGTQTSNYSNSAEQRATSVTNIENERQAMSGVSQDEEFTNMIKYQYAYNASARMVTMLDSMLDTIINGL